MTLAAIAGYVAVQEASDQQTVFNYVWNPHGTGYGEIFRDYAVKNLDFEDLKF